MKTIVNQTKYVESIDGLREASRKLSEARKLITLIELQILSHIPSALDSGATWDQVGDALGRTKGSAHLYHSKLLERYGSVKR